MLEGCGTKPGAVGVQGREPPLAAQGDEYTVQDGVFAGQGAAADKDAAWPGCAGAVRIIEKKYSRWYM